MENIRLDYLKTFLIVTKARSFSIAAKELSITQGAVSHHIAALEEFFDTELFKRTANGVENTETGEILAAAAERIFAEVEKAKVKISLTKQKLSGVIRINVSSIPGEHIIPSLVSNFQKKHPYVKFKIKAEDSINSIIDLQQGEVEFAAVGTVKGYREKLETIELGEEELVLIVPTDHELANREFVSLDEIARYPYISREETSGTRKEIERMLEDAGFPSSKLQTSIELASTESVVTAVSEGRGISIISSIASRKAQAAGLVKVVRIERVNSTRKLYMVRSKRPLVKVSEAFWEFCKKYTSQNVNATTHKTESTASRLLKHQA
ncbi:MAG: selenium metabolism-associated LysR family transcriptional regulator [Candidatus Bathyarchaeia archaeon]